MRASVCLALLLALLSCHDGGGASVQVTIRADASLDASALSAIRSFVIHADGAEIYEVEYPITSQLSSGEARWLYRSDATAGTLTFTVSGRDAAGALLATGTSAPIVLRRDAASSALVILTPPASMLDGGVPDGAPASDLATPTDGFDPSQDIALPPDLAPPVGLAAWYRFEDTTGLVLDSSGNGNHGTAEGSGFTRGVAGNTGLAILFDGTDGRVHIPAAASLETTSGFTVELWLKLTSANTTASTVSRGTGNSDDHILQNTSIGNLQTDFSHGGTSNNGTTANNLIPAGVWTHVCAVNDGTHLYTYINGVLIGDSSGGLLGPLASDLYLGRREQGVFPLDGALDEVKWWTVARTQPQVCADAGGAWTGLACAL